MSRYRKLPIKMWGEANFQNLSPMQPSGQSLYLFLLTGPHTTIIPGLFNAGRARIAEDLGWDVEDFDKAFKEIEDLGMAKADFKSKLVWLPEAIMNNKPESPNVVKAWSAAIDLLPHCQLKLEAVKALGKFLDCLGEPFAKPFKAIDKGSEKPPEKASFNQEQQQEQQQERAIESDDPIVDNLRSAETICRELRALGIDGANHRNPNLIRLLKAGVTEEELLTTALEPKSRGKSFHWLIATVEGRLNDAISKGSVVAKSASPWFMSAKLIVEKGAEYGLTQEPGEQFPAFRSRVFAAAGVTNEMIRKAKIDSGQ